jgi:precorrin-3B synthase
MSGRARGQCPSLFEPMQSGDGMLVRIKPPCGRLSTDAAQAIADAARRWGNGQFELTNRGALQARGFSEASLPPFRAAVLAAGLARPDPAVERRRNVAVTPFAGPEEAVLAAELEHWLAGDTALAALPPKFGIGLEAPGSDPRPMPGDICVARNAESWRITPAGSALTALTARPVATLRFVVGQFLKGASSLPEPPRRMADFVRRVGPEAVLQCAGVTLTPARPARPAGSPAVAGKLGDAFALGLPFGALTSGQLVAAANLAGRFGSGELRLSPWRALVLRSVAAPSALSVAARAADFIVDPADPLLSISACPGAPSCKSGYAPTRADAASLAARRPHGQVHLSGCMRGCAHPGPTDFTLVAAHDGYALVRRGCASDPPEARGLTLKDAARLLCGEVA